MARKANSTYALLGCITDQQDKSFMPTIKTPENLLGSPRITAERYDDKVQARMNTPGGAR